MSTSLNILQPPFAGVKFVGQHAQRAVIVAPISRVMTFAGDDLCVGEDWVRMPNGPFLTRKTGSRCNSMLKIGLRTFLAVGLCAPLAAQWKVTDNGIPRLQSGKPHLNAPAPRSS